jgi:hypothetical protein
MSVSAINLSKSNSSLQLQTSQHHELATSTPAVTSTPTEKVSKAALQELNAQLTVDTAQLVTANESLSRTVTELNTKIEEETQAHKKEYAIIKAFADSQMKAVATLQKEKAELKTAQDAQQAAATQAHLNKVFAAAEGNIDDKRFNEANKEAQNYITILLDPIIANLGALKEKIAATRTLAKTDLKAAQEQFQKERIAYERAVNLIEGHTQPKNQPKSAALPIDLNVLQMLVKLNVLIKDGARKPLDEEGVKTVVSIMHTNPKLVATAGSSYVEARNTAILTQTSVIDKLAKIQKQVVLICGELDTAVREIFPEDTTVKAAAGTVWTIWRQVPIYTVPAAFKTFITANTFELPKDLIGAEIVKSFVPGIKDAPVDLTVSVAIAEYSKAPQ